MHSTHNTSSRTIRGQSVERLNRHSVAAIGLHALVNELFDRATDVESYSTAADPMTEISRGIDRRLWFVESQAASSR
jgi:hypothetical protein